MTRRDGDRWVVVAVALVAAVVAIVLWRRYLPHWEQLWTDVVHDRSAHLDFGLEAASDLRHLRLVDLARDLNSFRTWPALHDGVLVGVATLVTGLDPRAAVVPSLVAFAGTAVVAFLLTRRLLPRGGNLGGVLAAALVLASPAMRAFATDVMIESPGAFLTVLVLYAAVRARQHPTPGAWRFLAISLSALFFTKYNYWFVATLAVLPMLWPLRAEWRRSALPPVLRWSVRVVVVGLLLVAAASGFEGDRAITTAMVAGWVAFVATLVWARTTGEAFLAAQPAARMLLWWQVVPALAWCCLPGKLQSLLWVLWPFTNEGEAPSSNRIAGVGYYARAFADDYQSAVWVAVVVGLLVVVAVVAYGTGRLRPGASTVLLLLVLAALATVPHPNRKSRFLHPLVPVVWVVAGVGLGAAVDAAGRRRTWALAGAAAVGGALVLSQVPALGATARAPEGGVQRDRPTALALTDAYLPWLDDARAPAIVSNVPLRWFARWTDQVRSERSPRPVTEIPGFDPARADAANRRALDAWLASGAVDRVVLVDLEPPSPWFVRSPETAGLATLPAAMRAQSRFVEVRAARVGQGARVSLWEPADG